MSKVSQFLGVVVATCPPLEVKSLGLKGPTELGNSKSIFQQKMGTKTGKHRKKRNVNAQGPIGRIG